MNSKHLAALVFSAAFTFSELSLAQVEVVELTTGSAQPSSSPSAQTPQSEAATSQTGELFYQLQLMQQEIMQLRGIVEEQAHELQKLKQQSMERYIDLDRRIGAGSAASTTGGSATPGTSGNDTVPAAIPVIRPVTPLAAQPGEKKAYSAAYNLVTGKQFEAALEAFKQFLVDYPGGQYAGNSYYWLGELYQVISPQDLEAARQAFSQLLNQFPDHAKAADAMYKLGKVYFLKGNKDKSRLWLEKVVAQHGDSSSAAKAAQFLKDNF